MRPPPPPFKTGDKVRLTNGKSPIMIVEVDFLRSRPSYYTKRAAFIEDAWYVRYCYLSSLHRDESEIRRWRIASDFVLYDQPLTQKKEIPMTKPLYQTKEEKPRFGTFLITNSKGKMVLEMKGREGEIETFDPSEIEEVMPYTVHMRRFHGSDQQQESRHYEMVEGTVQVDDVLVQLSNGSIWGVVEIDTKNRNPTQTKNGFFKMEGKRL